MSEARFQDYKINRIVAAKNHDNVLNLENPDSEKLIIQINPDMEAMVRQQLLGG